MGQKQSYSLNDYNSKNAVNSEVAQTFNLTEPTPVSLKPVTSVRSSSNNILVNTGNETELSTIQIAQPSLSPTISAMTSVDELYVDPELPHLALVLDKENNNLSADTIVKCDFVLQPEGLIVRQEELEDKLEKVLYSPVSAPFDDSDIQKLQYSGDEIVVEELALSVDVQPESQSISIFLSTKPIAFPVKNVEHLLCRTIEIDEV